MKAIREIPEDITLAVLEVVVMPNGEIISMGKTIGWLKNFIGAVFTQDRGQNNS